MTFLSPSETKFIMDNECCRIASSLNGKPHVVPVSYIYNEGFFYISTDYETKKFTNIKKNPYVCLVIDDYMPGNNKGITLSGEAGIIESGRKYLDLYNLFYNSFKWVRDNPWQQGEAPFLEIHINTKSSWGLN